MPSVAGRRVAASNRALRTDARSRRLVAAPGEGLVVEPVVVVDAVRPSVRTANAPTLAVTRIFYQHTECSELIS